MHRFFGLLLIGATAACGGGGGGTVVPTPSDAALFAAGQTVSRSLQNTTVSSSSFSASNASWTVDYPSLTVTVPGGSGTLDPATGKLPLSPSGEITLTNPAGTDYVLMSQTTGATGVVGEVTATMPAITTASYGGKSRAVVIDSDATYDLSGNATVSVNFSGGGDVDVTLSGLSGTRNTGTGSSTVSGHSITINNASISGTSISGGTFGAGAGQYSTGPIAGGSLSHSGSFFGPDATEIGGAAGYNATGVGTDFSAIVNYIGKQ